MNVNIVNQIDQPVNEEIIKKVLEISSKDLHLEDYTINIILVNNDIIQHLNKSFRNKDQATDVLTFPDGSFKNLGDIFISLDKVEEQRLSYEHSFERELAFLTVHGLLHTLGYDHQTKEEEKEMFTLQETLLQKAKITR
jgi:probable rRNA maturation factor